MKASAFSMPLTLRLSMGMGSGPTPAPWQAAPQKGWSPKNGTMKVGRPARCYYKGGDQAVFGSNHCVAFVSS